MSPHPTHALPLRRVFAVVALLLAALAVLALAQTRSVAVAATKHATPTVRAVHNATLRKEIVVNAHGRTTYRLSPETTHHLLCKSAACFSAWPPVTVASAKTKLVPGPGVHGKLAILHRAGRFQVTLRGEPLYTFAGDSGKNQSNGEGLMSFGGTWHAVTAAS